MIKQMLLFVMAIFTMAPSCNHQETSSAPKASTAKSEVQSDTDVQPVAVYIQGKGYEKYEVATFAGGCFWCTEASFERISGVADVFSGYSGGVETYPTYEEVSNKQTSHAEAIQIYFDPAITSFAQLLEVFFVAHDPTTLNRQGPDVGPQYRSEIFYHNDAQKQMAESYIAKLNSEGKFDNPIVTRLSPYKEFWVAEGYHQDYYQLNPQNSYIRNVSRPKVEKVEKTFKGILKEEFRQ